MNVIISERAFEPAMSQAQQVDIHRSSMSDIPTRAAPEQTQGLETGVAASRKRTRSSSQVDDDEASEASGGVPKRIRRSSPGLATNDTVSHPRQMIREIFESDRCKWPSRSQSSCDEPPSIAHAYGRQSLAAPEDRATSAPPRLPAPRPALQLAGVGHPTLSEHVESMTHDASSTTSSSLATPSPRSAPRILPAMFTERSAPDQMLGSGPNAANTGLRHSLPDTADIEDLPEVPSIDIWRHEIRGLPPTPESIEHMAEVHRSPNPQAYRTHDALSALHMAVNQHLAEERHSLQAEKAALRDVNQVGNAIVQEVAKMLEHALAQLRGEYKRAHQHELDALRRESEALQLQCETLRNANANFADKKARRAEAIASPGETNRIQYGGRHSTQTSEVEEIPEHAVSDIQDRAPRPSKFALATIMNAQ